MTRPTQSELTPTLAAQGIIAVLEIERTDDAVPVCRALLDGGIGAIELALRTAAAEPSVPLICTGTPEMLIGIGTIIMPGQAERVRELGASFGLAPGFNPVIVAESAACGLPFVPGIATPSELEGVLETGLRLFKFFPAEPSGGVNFLKSMNNPYNYLGMSYIPLGGITEENLGAWANMAQVAAIGGTWIAPRDLINAHNWQEITRRAKRAKRVWNAYRSQ
ncbi:MAG: bifunctional 4-hydroxy-2-oxoglutarate aldolase/2-dehydro-3-deoxy-phosphogluconate aldolase [Spirochaetaceae bacterium]|jgi:2-dehydro-3-deoxyphosphogluconate aldolase/(4S)-4-hydroxy-2-oxoglutarate aldolase|nr:bifunctional 4-hydroxy-2-oxoglutarate aldolase/2-dehydro-3-deoxy-phosphogluconate aldolase [Spirochaetaceae bacterium]